MKMKNTNIAFVILGIGAISYYIHILGVINKYWGTYKRDGQIMIAYNDSCINWVIFSTICLILFFVVVAKEG